MTVPPLRAWWPLLAATALSLAALAVVAFVPNWAETVPGQATCLPRVDVSAQRNTEMEGAAARLRADRRVVLVTVETKESGYARFKQVFADRPDVVASIPPDRFPAVAHAVLVPGTDARALVEDLRKQFSLDFQIPRCF